MNIDRLIKQTKKVTDKQVQRNRLSIKTSDDSIIEETNAIHKMNELNNSNSSKFINSVLGK